jgi:hypothetical protein
VASHDIWDLTIASQRTARTFVRWPASRNAASEIWKARSRCCSARYANRSIDERLEALTMNLESASRDIHDLRSAIQEHEIASQRDAESIRALAVSPRFMSAASPISKGKIREDS